MIPFLESHKLNSYESLLPTSSIVSTAPRQSYHVTGSNMDRALGPGTLSPAVVQTPTLVMFGVLALTESVDCGSSLSKQTFQSKTSPSHSSTRSNTCAKNAYTW